MSAISILACTNHQGHVQKALAATPLQSSTSFQFASFSRSAKNCETKLQISRFSPQIIVSSSPVRLICPVFRTQIVVYVVHVIGRNKVITCTHSFRRLGSWFRVRPQHSRNVARRKAAKSNLMVSIPPECTQARITSERIKTN